MTASTNKPEALASCHSISSWRLLVLLQDITCHATEAVESPEHQAQQCH